LLSEKPGITYSIVVAKGTCAAPPTGGIPLTEFTGDMLKEKGAIAQVDTPVVSFTGGDYVIVVHAGIRIVSCGVVHRTGPV